MSTTKVENRGRIFDALAELKDAGLIAASAAGTVDASAAIFDAGGTDGAGAAELPDNACAVIDISACEIASGDELYHIAIEVSDESDFSSDYTEVAVLEVGATAVLAGDVGFTTGRFVVPVSNNKGGEVFRYVRVYCTITGTIATGINYTCFLSKT